MLESTRLAEKRSRAPWMEALKTEQEAYGCMNKALLEEFQTSFTWEKVSCFMDGGPEI